MNKLYRSAEQHKTLLFNLLNDKIMVVLANHLYVPDVENHTYLSDVPKEALATNPIELNNKTLKNGVFDADNTFFVNVKADQIIKTILIYKWNARASRCQLIACINAANGFPIISNGGDITVTWDNGRNKIFALPVDHLKKIGLIV